MSFEDIIRRRLFHPTAWVGWSHSAGRQSAVADQALGLGALPQPGRGHRIGWNWLFALLIPICAVTPWLVPWPWQHTTAAPTSDPSSIIRLAHSQAVTGRAKSYVAPPPSDASVRAVAKDAAVRLRGRYDVPVSAAAAASVRTTPGRYKRLGKIAIPRIGLNVSFGEGVYAKALDHGPGHWPGTPMPGEAGNTVISGHRNTHTAPFKYLNLLKHGDKIVVRLSGDKATTYRVTGTSIVREAKFKKFVLRQPSDPDTRALTLFACHPEGNPVFRIVIHARANG